MELWVIACFGLIAWMNAAVGHGGASGYTALMVLAGFAQVIIRPVALELNLLVSALATWHFFRAGYFRKRLFLSLILLSVPMAYLGSLTVLPDRIYKVLLGCCLLISVVRIAIPMGHSEHNATRLLPTWLACIIGGTLLAPIKSGFLDTARIFFARRVAVGCSAQTTVAVKFHGIWI